MKKYLAEILGTFILVFCGTGAIIINQQSGGAVTHVGIAITFGLVVTAMIYSFGDISGAHLNPAVSLTLFAIKQLAVKDFLLYTGSQLLGALLASGTLNVLFPNNETLGATLPVGSDWQSFVLEFILTFILMLTIFLTTSGTKEKQVFSPLAIGFVVLLEALFAGPICGASMNPARSFAPAVVSGHTQHLWIYLSAPFLGALVSSLFYKLFRAE